jgi:uncharacterized protein (DUF1697 family)
MVYVALLRGINVGGNNKVDMRSLKETFENVGMTDVTTYINSGNVIFRSSLRSREAIAKKLEAAIKKDFGLEIRVLIRDLASMRRINKALPDNWTNDASMRCDVVYLWKEFDRPAIVNDLKFKPEIEDVVYVPGAIIWRVDRDNQTRSGLQKVVGTDLYRGVTIRNCNTARKLLALMEQLAS